jgi:hypothetical protein
MADNPEPNLDLRWRTPQHAAMQRHTCSITVVLPPIDGCIASPPAASAQQAAASPPRACRHACLLGWWWHVAQVGVLRMWLVPLSNEQHVQLLLTHLVC